MGQWLDSSVKFRCGVLEMEIVCSLVQSDLEYFMQCNSFAVAEELFMQNWVYVLSFYFICDFGGAKTIVWIQWNISFMGAKSFGRPIFLSFIANSNN